MWVPEGKFWVRMESGTNVTPNTVTIHEGNRPVQSTTGGKRVVFNEENKYVYERKVEGTLIRGIANCIKLTYHEQSTRFGFTDEEFVDIEVLFYNNPACPDPQT